MLINLMVNVYVKKDSLKYLIALNVPNVINTRKNVI